MKLTDKQFAILVGLPFMGVITGVCAINVKQRGENPITWVAVVLVTVVLGIYIWQLRKEFRDSYTKGYADCANIVSDYIIELEEYVNPFTGDLKEAKERENTKDTDDI